MLDMKDSEMKVFEGECYTVKAHERSCFFCKHCTDIFYDYTHGPYLLFCDIDCDIESAFKGQCDKFEDDTL
jgi:hypothetical protein